MQIKRIATIITVVVALTLILATSSTVAGPPVEGGQGSAGVKLAGTVASKVSYQGRLTDAAGNPLNGNYNLVFQLWNDATAGSQVGSDIVRNNVPVSNGLFTVELEVPQDAFNGQALWLRVQVNGQWLSPRQELQPVPYALSLRPGAQIRGDSTAPAVLVTNSGLGSTAVQAHGDGVGLDAQGQTGVQAVGWAVGVDASGMTGVRGEGDIGVRGNGLTGVHGESEIGYGVVGVTNAPMTATTAAGVYGESMNVYGVEGFSQFGVGVFGHSQGGFSAGVSGSGTTGVHGIGGLVGVSGYTESDDGTGVAGTATGYNSKGVEGNAQLGTGVVGSGEIGVKGTSSVGFGVWGEGPTGVYAKSQSGTAFQADGDAVVQGDLTVTGNLNAPAPTCVQYDVSIAGQSAVEVPDFCVDRICMIMMWNDATMGAFDPGFSWPVFYMQNSADNSWIGGPTVSFGGFSFSGGGGVNGDGTASGVFLGGQTVAGKGVYLKDDGAAENSPDQWTIELEIDPGRLTRASYYICPWFTPAAP